MSGVPHELFDALRAASPVHFQAMPGEPGYWAVLTHADVLPTLSTVRIAV